jgi:hypothetical protein
MHWYDKNGNERYDATLKIARKEGLLPSVTSIDQVIASPGIEKYRENELIKASWHCGVMPYDMYTTNVKLLSTRHLRRAQKVGTIVHKMVERYLLCEDLFYKGNNCDIITAVESACKWIDENVDVIHGVETVLLGQGYAGKADLIAEINGELYIVDWKTTDPENKLKKDGTPRKNKMFHRSHVRQLSALQLAYEKTHNTKINIMNVGISTNNQLPGTWEKKWSPEEIRTGLLQFLSAKTIWEIENNYEALHSA